MFLKITRDSTIYTLVVIIFWFFVSLQVILNETDITLPSPIVFNPPGKYFSFFDLHQHLLLNNKVNLLTISFTQISRTRN